MLDYNGTLALDGELLDGVVQRLQALSDKLKVHVLTIVGIHIAQGNKNFRVCKLTGFSLGIGSDNKPLYIVPFPYLVQFPGRMNSHLRNGPRHALLALLEITNNVHIKAEMITNYG